MCIHRYKDLLDIFSGIINGLHYLHECSIIHFDLKPNNVLLDVNNIPKLADFGCSREKACTYITANMVNTLSLNIIFSILNYKLN